MWVGHIIAALGCPVGPIDYAPANQRSLDETCPFARLTGIVRDII
jgi:hypothetical protein